MLNWKTLKSKIENLQIGDDTELAYVLFVQGILSVGSVHEDGFHHVNKPALPLDESAIAVGGKRIVIPLVKVPDLLDGFVLKGETGAYSHTVRAQFDRKDASVPKGHRIARR